MVDVLESEQRLNDAYNAFATAREHYLSVLRDNFPYTRGDSVFVYPHGIVRIENFEILDNGTVLIEGYPRTRAGEWSKRLARGAVKIHDQHGHRCFYRETPKFAVISPQ